jgi:hypothetical protein
MGGWVDGLMDVTQIYDVLEEGPKNWYPYQRTMEPTGLEQKGSFL